MNTQTTQPSFPTISIDIPDDFSPKVKLNFELKVSLPDGPGVDMEEREELLQKMNPAGFIHAMFLDENQHQIPEELREHSLVFLGKIVDGSNYVRRVIYFYYHQEKWRWFDELLLRDQRRHSGALVVCLKA